MPLRPLLTRLLTLPPPLRRTLYTLSALATWAPLAIFFNDHIAQLMWVSGPSMYPFLNTDYNSTTRKDVVFVKMWNPWRDLKRGMVVALW
jgi:inner membrane protease subunit 2